MTSGIYTIAHVGSGRCYVGSSNNCAYRWYQHRWRLNRGSHPNTRLQRAWKKYGADAFIWSVIEACEVAALIEREQWHLDRRQPHVYNIGTKVDAVAQGVPLPEAVRQKISAALRRRPMSEAHKAALAAANKRRAGWTHSEDAKNAVRTANKGRIRSDSHREAISKAQTGNTHRLGKKLSPEIVARIAAKNRGKKRSEAARANLRAGRLAYLERIKQESAHA